MANAGFCVANCDAVPGKLCPVLLQLNSAIAVHVERNSMNVVINFNEVPNVVLLRTKCLTKSTEHRQT